MRDLRHCVESTALLKLCNIGEELTAVVVDNVSSGWYTRRRFFYMVVYNKSVHMELMRGVMVFLVFHDIPDQDYGAWVHGVWSCYMVRQRSSRKAEQFEISHKTPLGECNCEFPLTDQTPLTIRYITTEHTCTPGAERRIMCATSTLAIRSQSIPNIIHHKHVQTAT